MSDHPPSHPALSHLDEHGAARMVDVGDKPVTHRRAVATAFVEMRPEALALIAGGNLPKGDVLAVARIAGITAAKRTSDLIPLCHPLALTNIAVDIRLQDGDDAPPARPGVSGPGAAGRSGVAITASVETDGKTGVEMEALTAASVAALAIYDMCKAADRAMTITDIALTLKEGGRSGRWARQETAPDAD